MTPATRFVDRALCGLLGLLLAAAGAAAIAWHYQRLAPAVSEMSAPGLHTAVNAGWWPWALGAVAVILIAAGVWWLISHLPRPTHARTTLAGSDAAGTLRLDLDTAAHTAADALAAHDVITSAKATTGREHGHDVIAVTAATTPADLTAAARAAADVQTQLAAVLEGTPTHVRTLLHLKNSRTTRTRVR
jgi:hypothetical protein